MRTPESPLPTDMNPAGVEHRLRFRALRSSWIKRNSMVRPGGHLEDEKILFVRRAEYSVPSVETRLAWLPAAYPLRKECYTLARDEEGVVSVALPDAATRCRPSAVSAATGVALH